MEDWWGRGKAGESVKDLQIVQAGAHLQKVQTAENHRRSNGREP